MSDLPTALAPHGVFERRLTREILISERLRVQLLAAIPAITLILFLGITSSYPEAVDRAFQKMDRLRVGLLLGGFATYELFMLRSVERLIETDREPPVSRRYVNALVETSLPTLVLVYYMAIVGPVHALLLPPAFVYFVFILLSTLRLDFKLCVFSGVVASVEYGGLAWTVIRSADRDRIDPALASLPHHLGKAVILLASGIAAGFVARRLRKGFVKTLESVEERNRVVSVFGQHVSPAVVDQLLAQKADVKSELRDVCIMFLDVRNFTGFAEDKPPEEVVDYLNSLFEFMIESINRHHGIVNKFLGDGFMAVFGAPLADGQEARHAIDAAREILARLDELCADGSIPATRIGIGIHSGQALIGNVGSAMRKEYTVIGDAVNVASRLEAMNKELGSQLLVTERVFEQAGEPAESAVPAASLTVRGRKEPIQVVKLA